MNSALVLLAHGSPDPDWAKPIEQIASRIRLLQPQTEVAVAYLEHHPASLKAVISQLSTAGHRNIRIILGFISSGGRHLKSDIPKLVQALCMEFPDLYISLSSQALGEDSLVIEAMAQAALQD